MSPASPPEAGSLDARMRTSIVTVAMVGATFALVALLFSPAFGVSVSLGAAIATLNLWILARVIGSLLPSGSAGARAQSRAGWSLVALLKMLGLFAVVGLLMRHGVAAPVPMLVGFGSLPIGIVIGSLVSDRSGREEEDPAP